MRDERTMERDGELAAALREVAPAEPADAATLERLRAVVGERAAPGLARRRAARRWKGRVWLGGALAAGLALFALVPGLRPWPDEARQAGAAATALTVEELFDAELSDEEFRALLGGAAELDELLLIAAAGVDP